ncbi:MAG: YdcF family protein [Alphaproteobacteria bacterium]|nr:YdcF family protein [Alphaproteobacteria bacterium]MBV9905248.1 YdcF family protein [Alphaproteobacteria bacterium]
MGTVWRVVWRGVVAVVALLIAGAVALYLSMPRGNTEATHFDTLIVLGYPATQSGAPTPEMRERVLEAVREYKAGVAPHIIMTGGAAHNRFAEADVMAKLAAANGVPEAAIVRERAAADTLQNAAFSVKIMQARGWHSAEVISTPSHLPRAGMDFSRYPIAWRTHASRWPDEAPFGWKPLVYAYEVENTARHWLTDAK